VRDKVSGALYAATHGQGLLVSRDDGRTWRDDSVGLPSHDLHALAIDPQGSGAVLVWAVGQGLLRRNGASGAGSVRRLRTLWTMSRRLPRTRRSPHGSTPRRRRASGSAPTADAHGAAPRPALSGGSLQLRSCRRHRTPYS
jgi:hypothetical protein